ncbi:MAG: N-acetyl-gamma-glutamyl-phosphate reductase [Alphaproteobacteria bacterium MarineAlpha9_Bin4]|nr:N-acetyl-gamma-glutamyl-phosphate reductase [Pelagibacterales bacterium]PPR25207.1 MAG: N-acetyl-gamma-glutamyl-phosphate reductase [Alphaproteobacteria bacterium MarineAlpha9_Bin4]|tara:strand:- start:366 stop:1367 length:1002 start_codon:yes stop_codon:yes gene_type:complete
MGASGYTGAETLRILLKHPNVHISELIGEQSAGKNIQEIFSNFYGKELPVIKSFEDSNLSDLEIMFSCTPSGVLSKIINKIPKNITLIDLSSDFRFQDVNLYNNYYNFHGNPSFIKNFVYGLSEIFRKKIKGSKFISCPGCYPTSALLPLVPLLENNLVQTEDIIIDSKSGITGAGRNMNLDLLFSENFGSMKAYGNGNHRHKPEIEHIIDIVTNKKIKISFTPHIIPINRGILSTIYVKGSYKKVLEYLENYYKEEKFVKINKNGTIPKISDVVGTNLCRIGIINNQESDRLTIISVIDNLVKGASGQAVQNMNIIMNYPEELGLDNHSLSP